MIEFLTARLKRVFSGSSVVPGQSPMRSDDQPDPTRRMVLVGGAALIATGLLLPGSTEPAEAHSRRRSRRRGWRGHRHYYHRRRRSRYGYHRRRHSRYDFHSRRYSRYEYHRRRHSRRGGVEFYFGF